MARLMDYQTGEYIREATNEEIEESISRGAEGVFAIDNNNNILREDETSPHDRRVYVETDGVYFSRDDRWGDTAIFDSVDAAAEKAMELWPEQFATLAAAREFVIDAEER